MSEDRRQLNFWLMDVDSRVKTAIIQCFNNADIGGWQENHITTEVIEAISTAGTDLSWSNCPQRAQWQAYKLSGHCETGYGDIAILVKVWLTPSKYVEGVAFYEAKKQYFKNGVATGFRALKADQLSKINRNTSASQVILYDSGGNQGPCVTTIPTSFAHAFCEAGMEGVNGNMLHYYGRPWVVALGNNFRGFELDYSPRAVDTIKQLTQQNKLPFLINAEAAVLPNIDLELGELPSFLTGYSQIAGDAPIPASTPTPSPSSGGGPRFGG
ncbi:hypothetical protein [Metapseudomonas otitidis]|uniref:hypothetical protein n=1 Tax=Metapseudomonas otitidis TaxID=319939 RepID=UPI002096F156|nr:hypothetical protein [Pseudomonas otitidis]MCO7554623.1 hypothetical protein [Pseudomonas otitidis]